MRKEDSELLQKLNLWQKDNAEWVDDKLRETNKTWGSLNLNLKQALFEEFDQWQKEAELQNRAAREFHSRPEVIWDFKRRKLNHESGDYRLLYKKIAYWIVMQTVKIGAKYDYQFLCKLNNLHRNKNNERKAK